MQTGKVTLRRKQSLCVNLFKMCQSSGRQQVAKFLGYDILILLAKSELQLCF